MGQRHKHADIITAWAEGDEVEYRKSPEYIWKTAEFPGWYENYEYRVKPPKNKYRVGMFRSGNGDYYTSTVGIQKDADLSENYFAFVRWLTGWVEYSD